jgi:hypothetical protein
VEEQIQVEEAEEVEGLQIEKQVEELSEAELEESSEEPEPAPTWSRPRALTEFEPAPLPWTQIAHVAARLWLNDIEITITKCDTKKATADVLSLQNEWTKRHWTECIRVGGRYQVKGCWFEIETMSVVNSTLTIAPSGPPRPMQLALRLKEMGATLGVGEPDEEPEMADDHEDMGEWEPDEEAAEETEAPATVPFPSPRAGGPIIGLEGSEGAG